MRIAITKPLFAWESLEDSPSLQTVRDFLAAIPDGRLLDALRRARGKGRDDYPVRRRKIIKVATMRRSAYDLGAWRLLRDFGRGWPPYGRCWTSERAG